MRTGILLLALALAVSVQAQPHVPDEFGVDGDAISIISGWDFEADSGEIGTEDGLRFSRDGSTLRASLGFLPNGSRITRITYYYRDEDPNSNLEFETCVTPLDANTGAPLGSGCWTRANSAGIDGDSYFVDDHPPDIQYRQVVNGTTRINLYHLRVRTPSGTSATSIRAVEVLWRRRVSPAPQTPSFNDVPTNHAFFQFIEALADSGITAGCGNGNYCPDEPLTRGQMAAFLAKALGLHWAWNAP